VHHFGFIILVIGFSKTPVQHQTYVQQHAVVTQLFVTVLSYRNSQHISAENTKVIIKSMINAEVQYKIQYFYTKGLPGHNLSVTGKHVSSSCVCGTYQTVVKVIIFFLHSLSFVHIQISIRCNFI
jgi:hypothetical protein